MTKYEVTHYFPKTKKMFSITMKGVLEGLDDRDKELAIHIQEKADRGYELVSTSNIGYGIYFFWKKI